MALGAIRAAWFARKLSRSATASDAGPADRPGRRSDGVLGHLQLGELRVTGAPLGHGYGDVAGGRR